MPKYNPKIVVAFFKEHGIPEPLIEHPFAKDIGRRWRFDFAWHANPRNFMGPLALEIQGGIFIQGRHSRGAAMLKEWEKLNTAACMGWRILYCQPVDLTTKQTADMIKRALGI